MRRSMTPVSLHRVLVVLFALSLGDPAGAATASPLSDTSQAIKTSETQPGAEYILQIGDIIEVKLLYNPELNDRVTIRPDGKVSFQLVDEVKAAGLTPAELKKILVENYSRLFSQPEVAVIVREFAGQKVYIGGEVVAPKVVPLSGEMTALQAIMDAGGLKETAYTKNIVIISKGPQGAPMARKVNLSGAIRGESPQDDIVLKPFDIIFVPKSRIAKVNRFVEQYIRNLIPATLTAGFSYAIFRTNQAGGIQVIPTP